MSHDVASPPTTALQEADEKTQRWDVHRNILDVTDNVSRILTEKMHDLLLKEKTETRGGPNSLDGFFHCYLIVQSLYSSSEKVKFRVKLDWTGSEVKQEVHRLYDVPPAFQVLLINDKNVSDQQLIGDEMFAFKPVDQVIYIFLVKNKFPYEGSGIRIKDILDGDGSAAAGGQETVPSRVYDDFDDEDGSSSVTSQSNKTSSKKKEKKKQKKR